MHILEIVIYILAILLLGLIISNKKLKKQYSIALLSLTGIVLLLQIFMEGTRWQLYPLYLTLVIVMIMVYFISVLNFKPKNFVRIGMFTGLVLLLMISGIATYIFPVYELPTPNGEYQIGTQSFVIEDESREELYTEDTNDFRRIKIQIWYPTDSTDGYEQAPWLEDGTVVARGLARNFNLPSFVLDHMVHIMSNSYFNEPLSDALDQYPVIIISHGWTGFRSTHTDYAEELASLGYIVVGIEHAYGSIATVYSDDDIAYLNLDALPSTDSEELFLEYANQLVNTYAEDVTTTINYLEEINDVSNPSSFSERLDLTNIGLLGHSTGGGGDVAAAINDDRIDSVMGLDAWVEPIAESEINKGLLIPSLFIRSETWESFENNTDLYALIENSAVPSNLYQIDGTTHFDFAMSYMYSPLMKSIGFSGSIEDEHLNTILKSMITDFFNETLKHDTNSTIDIGVWDEVKMVTPE